LSLAERLHQSHGLDRRVRILSAHLSDLLPADARVLDVGCGDGTLAESLLSRRPDLTIVGIDVQVRDRVRIPVTEFDGRVLPLGDGSCDCVMLVDVLHHSDDPLQLLREATRVARTHVVIKDHRRNGFLAEATLRFMDNVGNRRFGVATPHNYWSHRQWQTAFRELGLEEITWNQTLGLYPWPFGAIFDRSLHFLASLRRVQGRMAG